MSAEPAKSPEFVNVVLSEFSTAKEEIKTRSQAQSNIIALDLTAVGVIGSLFFSKGADPRVLFLIPIISGILGLIYIDHAININKLGRFINRVIKPSLEAVIGDEIVDFERTIRAQKIEKGRLWSVFLLSFPILLLFAVIPFAALLLPFFESKVYDATYWVLAALGSTVVLLFLWFWLMITARWVPSWIDPPGSLARPQDGNE